MAAPLQERRTARELVQLGSTALPDFDRAFDSIEEKGWHSSLYENAGWLFFAYARILGSAAVPRLRRMRKDPELANVRRSLDDAWRSHLALPPTFPPWVASRRHWVADVSNREMSWTNWSRR